MLKFLSASLLMLAFILPGAAQEADSISVKQPDGSTLTVQLPAPGIIHVRATPAAGVVPVRFSAVTAAPQTPKGIKKTGDADKGWELTDGTVTVQAKPAGDGGWRLNFLDAAGNPMVQETGRGFTRETVGGAEFTGTAMQWESGSNDALYGLGQYQDGLLDIRGAIRKCHQKNLEDGVPLWVSSAGWGILWDNPAPFEFSAAKDGRGMDLKAPAAGEINYYVLAGPTLGQVIGRYRLLTGTAPLPPKWAFGYHQSKERYRSPNEVLEVARRFRESKFPIDLIIQDWQYWGQHGWNACRFDEERYPYATGLIAQLHASNLRYIVSVWPSFTEGPKSSEVYRELDRAGLLSPYTGFWQGMRYYDVFSPRARDIVWKHANAGLFSTGVDGWWLDATEPELGGSGPGGGHQTVEELNRFGTTSAGPFPTVANAYPLLASQTFHDGQRVVDPAKRVFILTRSAYAGSQRYGAFAWTGDTRCTWDSFRRQIPACLGMSLSGIPYVNTDIGGFACGYPGGCDNPEFRELVVRWFQFGAFCPEFRMHGTSTPREPWRFGKPGETTYDTLLAFAKFRYRMLPYIYSTAWQVTRHSGTMMRALPMDFPEDPACRQIPDQFLFGPSILAVPVLQPVASPAGEIIPATALLGRDGKPGGLDATYFQGTNFETQKLERRDAEIRFNWAKQPRSGMGADPALDPIPELGDMDHFSARWEGSILPAESGEHVFTASGDDGFRLWIDGKLICQDWNARPLSTASGNVTLTAGKAVPVKLDYFQDKNDAIIELRWKTPAAAQAGATAKRTLCLPAGTTWTDFWTGEKLGGGQQLVRAVPLSQMPLFLRAGTILPLGPEMTWCNEKPADPLEIRLCPGADGQFEIYEDSGDGYGYEKGEHAIIPISWTDKTRTLTFGARQGSFPGMLKQRTIRIAIVRPGHGIGPAAEANPDATFRYDGSETKLILKTE